MSFSGPISSTAISGSQTTGLESIVENITSADAVTVTVDYAVSISEAATASDLVIGTDVIADVVTTEVLYSGTSTAFTDTFVTEVLYNDVPSNNNISLTGVSATTAVGSLTGDHPTVLLVGVSATSQSSALNPNRVITLGGQAVSAVANGDVFNIQRNVNLVGVTVQAEPTPHTVFFPAGGGGGGAAGLFGNGEDGGDGSPLGIGGYGGAADNFLVPRQVTPGSNGNSGTEFGGGYGAGSGGAGGNWVEGGVGQDGGDGGLYGGGGGGGGGGTLGGGQGGQGADGVVFIQYQGSSGLVTIILDKNSPSPWVVPADWSSTNKIIIVGPGGCGEDGSTTSGGNGGVGGDTVGVENTLLYNPGDLIPFQIPATPCTETPTVFGSYQAAPGANGSTGGGEVGGGGTGSVGFPGGFIYDGGNGGPKGVLSPLSLEPIPPLTGVQATALIGSFGSSGVPGPRVFIIAGIKQEPIPPGIVMLPTSETIAPVTYNSNMYVIGSSQYYSIGEVYWNSLKKTEGVDWEFVDPFKHIIRIINTGGISTNITLVYYQWDIGVRTGFKVNSHPVPFGFIGTRIVAERAPAQGEMFTIEYMATRSGDNPRSLIARYPNIVDDLLVSHTLYDGSSGFETYRPNGYRVFDTSDNQIWRWNGSSWAIDGVIANGGHFYVKRLRAIYQFSGGTVTKQFEAGDSLPTPFSQVLSYPAFGEGVGKNLLVDGFSGNAAVDYPQAYEIVQNPGDYDPWVGT